MDVGSLPMLFEDGLVEVYVLVVENVPTKKKSFVLPLE